MKYMYLPVAAQGAGKSFLCKKIKEHYIKTGESDVIILSTDHFWMKNGQYCFDKQSLFKGHKWNQQRTEHCCEAQHSVIIVDNTNVNHKERQVYVNMAIEHGYEVRLVEPNTAWRYDAEECAKRNIHGVPFETCDRSIRRILNDKKVSDHWTKYYFDLKDLLGEL